MVLKLKIKLGGSDIPPAKAAKRQKAKPRRRRPVKFDHHITEHDEADMDYIPSVPSHEPVQSSTRTAHNNNRRQRGKKRSSTLPLAAASSGGAIQYQAATVLPTAMLDVSAEDDQKEIDMQVYANISYDSTKYTTPEEEKVEPDVEAWSQQGVFSTTRGEENGTGEGNVVVAEKMQKLWDRARVQLQVQREHISQHEAIARRLQDSQLEHYSLNNPSKVNATTTGPGATSGNDKGPLGVDSGKIRSGSVVSTPGSKNPNLKSEREVHREMQRKKERESRVNMERTVNMDEQSLVMGERK